MKKAFILVASAALLLVSCAKEAVSEQDSGLTTASFTAGFENAVATKAIADNDGNGANVTRCIMEIYYGDQLYKRLEQPVSNKTATFSNVSVVAGKKYRILFWADCGNGLEDKYFNAVNLKSVKVIKDAFLAALKSKDNDKLDAFFFSDDYTVPQGGGSYGATLTRPFAQLNIITTDVGEGNTVTSTDLLPEKVSVSYTGANEINVATGEVSGSEAYSYEASVYGDWATVTTDRKELTLSMDYILAAAEKSMIDVTFNTKNGDAVVMNHSLTNLPCQRNYRTNVKGQLLTVGGTWTATIEPNWATPAYDVPFYVATSIQDAQNYISSQNDEQKKAVDLTQATISQSDVNVDKTIHFILKTTSPKDLVNFTLPAIPTTIQNCEGWTIEYESNYPTENVGVNAPEGTKVVINAPTSHVTVTGTTYVEIIASTGDNTLVIPHGVSVETLKITKGAVEIHGTVGALVVEPETGKTVCFRECEGLSATVFAKIYSETEPVCNYIDPMYTYELVGEKYNIYKLPVVAMIGDVEYKSLSDAVAAVPSGNTELVTIKVMSDVVINADALAINKNNVVLDGQGHTIAIDETDTRLDKYLVDGTSKKYGSFQMIKVSGNDVTLKNMTLDSKNYRGASLATTWGGKNATYENIVYKGLGSGHYYGYAASNGILKFKDCTFETHGYAIHTAESSTELEVSNCDIHGWVSYGDKTIGATFTNTHFYSAEDQYNGVIATIRPYCATTITNCTFSKEYLTKYKYDGLTVRSNVVVSLNCCSVEDGELCDIANITCPDDPWAEGGVIAIDATGNATDGFSAGTFVAKQASDIKAAPSYVVSAVEGKDNIWTIDGPYEARIGQVYFTKLQDAVDAVQTGETITLLCNVTNFLNIEDVLLKDFSVDAQGTGFDSFYIKNATTGIRYYDGGKTIRGSLSYPYETLEIPEGVTATIGAKNYENTGLKYVKLPSTMRVLGDGAFCKAHQLEKIYYKDGDEYKEGLAPYLTQIGGAVFQETESFNMSIVIPEGITSVGRKTFYESSVRSVVLPEGLISIGSDGLRGARNMTEITIPASLQTIGSQAFRDCTNLKTINLLFETVPETIGSYTFNAVSAAFGATTPGVIYVKNQAVADALWNVFDSNAKNYYSIKDYDDHSIVYYKGSKIE